MIEPSKDDIYHHGTKGMHWGVRKSRTTEEKAASRAKFKRNAKIAGATTVAVGGAAVAAYLLTKSGSSPIKAASSLKSGLTKKDSVTQAVGKEAVSALSQTIWKTQVSKLSSDIATANAEQDHWMRKNGLGHVVNNAR